VCIREWRRDERDDDDEGDVAAIDVGVGTSMNQIRTESESLRIQWIWFVEDSIPIGFGSWDLIGFDCTY
jgi:hypothetical protein